jgi:hypothetical protein
MSVTTNDVAFYQENGYVHIPNFLSNDEVKNLKQEIQNIKNHAQLPDVILPHIKYMGTKYHLDSVDTIDLFFENQYVKDGKLSVSLIDAVHKIGHGVHVKSSVVKDITFGSKMKKAVKSLTVFNSATVVQSMFLLKQPLVGEASPVHIDETYLMTDPAGKVAGVWIALDDATETNGCLEFLPKSHKTHTVTKNWIRKAEAHEPGKEWESLMKFTNDNGQETPVNESDFVKVPVNSGGLVLIHGRVLHKSNPNNSLYPRSAFTFHVYDNEARWSSLNWIQEKPQWKFPVLF